MEIEVKEYKEGMELKGFIANMPNDVYHAQRDFISNSGLSLIAKSPAHYKANPQRKTASLTVGGAFHTFMLEPKAFEDFYVLIPELPDRRCKAFNDAAKIHGKERILIGREIDELNGMKAGLAVDSRNQALLDKVVHRELSLFTQCPDTGIKVRVRFDGLTSDLVAIDPKTTRDASAEQFSRSITDYRYHVQHALYSDAFFWETGQQLNGFVFMAIESAEPYLTMPYVLDDIAVAIGRYEYKRCLNIYQRCLETDDWHGYEKGGEIANLNSITEWEIRKFDDEIGLSGVL